MEELHNKELYQDFTTRLCMCNCSVCENRSPHPIYNCFHECENVEEITEDEKLRIGMYRKCYCTCTNCLTSKK